MGRFQEGKYFAYGNTIPGRKGKKEGACLERRALIGGHACMHVMSVPFIMGLTVGASESIDRRIARHLVSGPPRSTAFFDRAGAGSSSVDQCQSTTIAPSSLCRHLRAVVCAPSLSSLLPWRGPPTPSTGGRHTGRACSSSCRRSPARCTRCTSLSQSLPFLPRWGRCCRARRVGLVWRDGWACGDHGRPYSEYLLHTSAFSADLASTLSACTLFPFVLFFFFYSPCPDSQ